MPKETKRPSDTAFTQQRLRAWRPILTPKFVIPSLFIIGILLLPFGILLFVTSEKLTEIVVDYTQCQNVHSTNLTSEGLKLPSSNHANMEKLPGLTRWSFDPVVRRCDLEVNVPEKIEGPLFLYYELGNYYQNYRKYVSSVEPRQLKGEALLYSDLSSCDPLIGPDDDLVNSATKPLSKEEKDKLPVYFPCGSIADSMFLDDIDPIIKFADSGEPAMSLTSEGIAWETDRKRYALPDYPLNQIRVPPSWQNKYGKTPFYTDKSLIEKWVIHNEHFQVWMRTSPFSTFRKLYAKNVKDSLLPGKYVLSVFLYTDVIPFEATKSIVLSNLSWQGGKNNILGLIYLVTGIVLILTGLIFLVINCFIKREAGDYKWLSWNQDFSKSKSSSFVSRSKSSFASPISSTCYSSSGGSNGLLSRLFRKSSSS